MNPSSNLRVAIASVAWLMLAIVGSATAQDGTLVDSSPVTIKEEDWKKMETATAGGFGISSLERRLERPALERNCLMLNQSARPRESGDPAFFGKDWVP